MPALPGVPPNIALIQGPVLLGALFSYGLLGILIMQLFLYDAHFPEDRRWIKALVWTIFFAELLSSAFVTHYVWTGMAAGWGNLDSLAGPTWSLAALPPISGFISSAVQIFFCWRIWKLGHGWILPALTTAISLLQWGMAFYSGIKFALVGTFAKISVTDPEVTTWLSSSAACDVIITVTMLRFLLSANASSKWLHTQSTLNKLIKLTVETGMITALAAVLELIFFWVFRDNNMHFLPFLMLGKFYSNTLLAMLNARASFSTRSHAHSSDGRSVALWEDAHPPASGKNRSVIPAGIRITTTTEQRDSDMQMVVLNGDGDTKGELEEGKSITPL